MTVQRILSAAALASTTLATVVSLATPALATQRASHVCGTTSTDYRLFTKPAGAGKEVGLLVIEGERALKVTCEVVPPPPADAPIIPDGITGILSCVEARGGDGRYLVEIWTGGFMGGTWAEVRQEQIFPLEPAFLTTIPCDRNIGRGIAP